jgi:hypothetical protein
MEGTAGLASMVVGAASMLEALLLREAVLLGKGDLLTVERQMQQVLRQVGSLIVSGALHTVSPPPQLSGVASSTSESDITPSTTTPSTVPFTAILRDMSM